MDSGFLTEGEALDNTFDILKELLPEEVVGLMDQMLCHEVRSLRLSRAMVVGSYLSDADLRVLRWHGIWVIRSRRHSSRRIILTDCSGLSLRKWKMPASTGMKNPARATNYCMLFFEHTVWQRSSVAPLCTGG